MGYARKSLVSLNDTPYYHVIARCVRRAWLWGVDEYAGKDYSHRKHWVLERLQRLSQVFAVDICAYAVMSNHYHLVLHVDQARAAQWSAEQIAERWGALFSVPVFVRRWRAGLASEAERHAALLLIEHWRARLIDVSWYMRCLNEHLARRANAEDQCTGRFWEGRFRSQALLDEAGLLTAMAYVDLNPLRAGIAATPEASEFTSIYARIQQLQSAATASNASTRLACSNVVGLLPFQDSAARNAAAVPYRLLDYLDLLDWSGRTVRTDKRGAIDPGTPPILMRLRIDPKAWQSSMRLNSNVFGRAMGRLDHLRMHAKTLGQSWVKGMARAQRMYSNN